MMTTRKIDDTNFCNFRPSINQDKLNEEVEQIILDMVNDERFREYILNKVEEKIDVSSLEKEHSNYQIHLRQAEGAKAKLAEQMDKLDVTDRHYNRKYQDMQDRLDGLYDRIEEIRESLRDVKERMHGVQNAQFTSHQLFMMLANYDKMYIRLTDLEKKEFYHTLIEKVDLYPERSSDGRILKRIEFKFPVNYEVDEGEKWLINENDVETVVCLNNKNAKLIKRLEKTN